MIDNLKAKLDTVMLFLGQTFGEFIWLLFSVAFGMALTAAALKIDPEVYQAALIPYGKFMVLVIFNAAALRVILRMGLAWLDTNMDAWQAAQAQQNHMARLGIKLAILQLMGKKVDYKAAIDTEPTEPTK